jgi:hypothetical protein
LPCTTWKLQSPVSACRPQEPQASSARLSCGLSTAPLTACPQTSQSRDCCPGNWRLSRIPFSMLRAPSAAPAVWAAHCLRFGANPVDNIHAPTAVSRAREPGSCPSRPVRSLAPTMMMFRGRHTRPQRPARRPHSSVSQVATGRHPRLERKIHIANWFFEASNSGPIC